MDADLVLAAGLERHSTSVAPRSAASGLTWVTARRASVGRLALGTPEVAVGAAQAVTAIAMSIVSMRVSGTAPWRWRGRRAPGCGRGTARQVALRGGRAREHHYPARVAIEPVDHRERDIVAARRAAAARCARGRRGCPCCPARRPRSACRRASRPRPRRDRVHDGRFGKGAGALLPGVLVGPRRPRPPDARRRVGAAFAVDRDAAVEAQLLRARPRGRPSAGARPAATVGRVAFIEQALWRLRRRGQGRGTTTATPRLPCP
jgi:hypothetical protein